MDLVASYDSEADDGLNIGEIHAASKATKSLKTVDIIELDSESDSDCASRVEKNISATPSTCPKELSMQSKSFDCIDLENEDSPCVPPCTKQNEPLQLPKKKKIDYLNLEGSDSEEERDNAGTNITSLMDSASMLSNIPCGPCKPSETIEKSKLPTDSNFLVKNLNSSVSPGNVNTDVQSSSTRNIPDFAQGNISRDSTDSPGKKRFKSNVSVSSDFQDDIEEAANEDSTFSIYREDARAIEASQKNAVCRIPRQIIQSQNAHSSIITSLGWCVPKYSYLFLSSSLDGSIKIWDLYKVRPIRWIRTPTAVNAAKWSLDGGQIVAGGQGEKAFVFDVETGNKIVAYDLYNVVTSMEIHPYMEDVFLCGTRNAILGFDIRVNSTFPIRSFFSKCEEVLDIAFLDENEFVCSTGVVSHDSSDRTIMVWDFSSGAVLSNQIYLERFTCPSLKVHPSDSVFVAQSNGNYIASFSTSRPYKRKEKVYMGHTVSGFGIECDISPDGKYVVTGDAEGNVFFYNYANTSSAHCGKVGITCATNRVKWHPTFSSTLITATYNGDIQIWK